jgi:thioredoxin reductase
MTCPGYDVAIVGGGAAGLSAALVLARARRRVVVLDAGNPRNALAAHMHNFLSRDGMPPAELLAVGQAEVLGYGAEIVSATVAGSRPPQRASTSSSTAGAPCPRGDS